MQAVGRVYAEPTKSPTKSDEKAPAAGTPEFDSEKLIKDVKQKVASVGVSAVSAYLAACTTG